MELCILTSNKNVRKPHERGGDKVEYLRKRDSRGEKVNKIDRRFKPKKQKDAW